MLSRRTTVHWRPKALVGLWRVSVRRSCLQALKALASSWEAAARLQGQGGGAAWSWDAASAGLLDAALAADESKQLPPKV
jgi:hypothetical protein